MTIRQILVPVDFSPVARAAFDQALQIAKGVGARLHIIHAMETLTYRGIQYAEILSAESIEKRREDAETDLDEWLAIAREAAVQAESHIVDGDVRHAVLEAARDTQADLIVIGARGHSKLAHLFGSTADFITRTAQCSVLVARITRS